MQPQVQTQCNRAAGILCYICKNEHVHSADTRMRTSVLCHGNHCSAETAKDGNENYVERFISSKQSSGMRPLYTNKRVTTLLHCTAQVSHYVCKQDGNSLCTACCSCKTCTTSASNQTVLHATLHNPGCIQMLAASAGEISNVPPARTHLHSVTKHSSSSARAKLRRLLTMYSCAVTQELPAGYSRCRSAAELLKISQPEKKIRPMHWPSTGSIQSCCSQLHVVVPLQPRGLKAGK